MVLSRHLRLKHRDNIKQRSSKGRWLQDHIHEQLQFQSWLASDILHSWQVKAKANPQPGQLTIPGCIAPAGEASALVRHLEELYAQELKRLSADCKHTTAGQQTSDASAASAALMSTWLRRTGWADLFKGARCDLLITLSALPCPHPGPLQLAMHSGRALLSSSADDDRLKLMVAAVDRLLDRCCDTVRHTDVSMRRWLRGRFADRPFKAPFELVARLESERKYRQLIKRCLCFWLRLWRLPQQISRTPARRYPYKAQQSALEFIWREPIWEKPRAQTSSALRSKSAKVNVQAGNDEEAFTPQDRPLEEGDDIGEELDEAGSSSISSCYSSDDEYNDEYDDEYNTVEEEREDDNNNCEDEDAKNNSEEKGVGGTEDPAADAILRFLYFIATEDFEDSQSSSTMLVYFSAVCGLSRPDDSNFLRPAQYTAHLYGLIYCIRLIIIEAILPRKAHNYVGILARPRAGQLAILQSLR